MEQQEMSIRRIDGEEYGRIFPRGGSHVFNSAEFARLNAGKCDALHFLVMSAGKRPRMGIVLGERGGRLLSPFSAPFGGFSYNSPQHVDVVDECVELLRQYGAETGKRIEIFLPPGFYDEGMLAKTGSALLRRGALMYADVNFHYDLRGITDDNWREATAGKMNQKARRKMRGAMEEDFRVEVLDRNREGDVERVYGVIAANRRWRGYPLRMSLDDVKRTCATVDAELIVMSHEGGDVASALVYRVSRGVMQVVYWGDVPAGEGLNVMHRFAPEVFRICRHLGADVLDIGPSSEEGVPSAGLCFFKESIGCEARLKPRFVIEPVAGVTGCGQWA